MMSPVYAALTAAYQERVGSTPESADDDLFINIAEWASQTDISDIRWMADVLRLAADKLGA